LSAGALPQTPLGEFTTALPQNPLLDFRGLLLREGRGERKGGDPLLSRYTPSHYILDEGLML